MLAQVIRSVVLGSPPPSISNFLVLLTKKYNIEVPRMGLGNEEISSN